MLKHINAERLLFIDIETARVTKDYETLATPFKEQFELKFKHNLKDGESFSEYYKREAGLHAAWGKIVVAVVGKLVKNGERRKLEMRTFSSENEQSILENIVECIGKLPDDVQIVAYNGREFDAPFIARRLLANSMDVPDKIDFSDKKPWEVQLVDPLEIWRFGQRNHYCKLELMCHLLGIPSSKDELRGEDVSDVFWDGGLEKIAAYCRKDVVATANIVLKLKQLPLLQPEDVVDGSRTTPGGKNDSTK